MRQDTYKHAVSAPTAELPLPPALEFDALGVILRGVYGDELSAFRAKRAWIRALDQNFLLDEGHDYEMKTRPNLEDRKFVLNCSFVSACGRYAFWRLINDQAPEVQYLLETGHVPNGDCLPSALVPAADLMPAVVRAQTTGFVNRRESWLRKAINRVLASLKPQRSELE